MDTEKTKNKWDQIIGVFLIGFGSFRLYQHYILGKEYETFRLILTFCFVGFGFFNLYKYFSGKPR